MNKHLILPVLIAIGINNAFSQDFINPDFESANLSAYGAGSVPAADAIPGWTAYLNGSPLQNIYYDVAATIVTNGVYLYNSANYGNYGLQGSYYVYFQGSVSEPVSIGQTVTIPTSEPYLVWWGFGGTPSFDGQTLTYTRVGFGSHYNILAADASAFAGQTGQILFTSASSPDVGGSLIDNIKFVSSIPERSSWCLLLLGSGFFLYVRRACHR